LDAIRDGKGSDALQAANEALKVEELKYYFSHNQRKTKSSLVALNHGPWC